MAALAAVDAATLRAELKAALSLTADTLRYVAALWAELERRGEDLGDLTGGVGRWVAKVAAGGLLPEAVVAFADRPQALGRVAKLGIEEQRAAVASGDVPVPRRTAGKTSGGCNATPPNPVLLAAVGSPRDVAETILDMVRAASDPADVARRLVPELERLGRVRGAA